MHRPQIIPLFCLAVSSVLFGLAYSDAVLYSPGFLISCLAFNFAAVLAYWICCTGQTPCQNRGDLQTGVRHETFKTLPSFWAKIKNWFSPAERGDEVEVSPSSELETANKDETTPNIWARKNLEGKIVVFRRTQTVEFLHVFDADMYLPKSCYKSPGRFVCEKIGVDPYEILALIKIQQNETGKMSFTCWLVELHSGTKVLTDSKWLSLEDSLAVASADHAKVLQACNNTIEAGGKGDPCSQLELMSKENEARSARLQHWQEDAGTDLLWAVQTKLEGGQVTSQADPKPFFDDDDENCTKEILITVAVSVASTVFLMTAAYFIFQYFSTD